MLQDQQFVAVNWPGKGKGGKEKRARVKMAMKRVRLLPRTATPLCSLAWEISGILFPVDLFFKGRLCFQDLTTFWDSACHCNSGHTRSPRIIYLMDIPLWPLIAAMLCRNRSIALAEEC
jgi:hypothetical protein